jgi:hypothetical protein
LRGFTIQSIVEGSDVYIYGEYMDHETTKKDVYDWIEEMERQVEFYWKRDNYRHFMLIDPDGVEIYVNSEFDWEEVEEDVPKEVKEAFVNMICGNPEDQCFPSFEEDTEYDIEGTGWKFKEFMDDCVY